MPVKVPEFESPLPDVQSFLRDQVCITDLELIRATTESLNKCGGPPWDVEAIQQSFDAFQEPAEFVEFMREWTKTLSIPASVATKMWEYFSHKKMKAARTPWHPTPEPSAEYTSTYVSCANYSPTSPCYGSCTCGCCATPLVIHEPETPPDPSKPMLETRKTCNFCDFPEQTDIKLDADGRLACTDCGNTHSCADCGVPIQVSGEHLCAKCNTHTHTHM
jgi:hypothetical protein